MTIAGYVPAIGETDLNKIVRSIRNIYENGAATADIPAPSAASVALASCGQLSYVNATSIKFAPFNGGVVNINGTLYTLPSAGVSAANTSVYVNGVAAQNLAASTLYYVYVFSNSGTLTIDFSTTGHATDTATGNIGTEIKSGDNTRTLIGQVFTNASAQFDDSATKRNVRSWFNRAALKGKGALTTTRQTSSATFVEVNAEARVEFVCWSDDAVLVSVYGYCFNTGSFYAITSVGFDGASTTLDGDGYGVFGGAAGSLGFAGVKTGLSEGHHYATIIGRSSNAGGTSTWGSSTAPNPALEVRI